MAKFKNKHFLIGIFGAIVMAIAFTDCSDNGKTSIEIDGKKYKVDKYVAEHYNPVHIEEALKRAEAQRNVIILTDASTLGRKMAEATWYAFEEDMKADKFAKKAGKVTVVHYETGMEIIKDGQHWFYDGFPYDEYNVFYVSASQAILDSPRWEPTEVKITDIGVKFEYLDMKNYNGFETWILTAREAFGIKDKDDIFINFKKY